MRGNRTDYKLSFSIALGAQGHKGGVRGQKKVQCAVFSLNYAVCCGFCEVCSVQFAVCSVQFEVCSVLWEVCSERHLVCTLHRAFGKLDCVLSINKHNNN